MIRAQAPVVAAAAARREPRARRRCRRSRRAPRPRPADAGGATRRAAGAARAPDRRRLLPLSATPDGAADADAEHARRRRRAPPIAAAAADRRRARRAVGDTRMASRQEARHDRRRRPAAASPPASSSWSKTGDDVQARDPHAGIRRSTRATTAAAGVELQTAMQAANVLYLDVGSYTNVDPATLKSVEPSIVYVAGDVAAAPGEVSVFVKDAESIVLVTTKPDGTCRACTSRRPGCRSS